MAFGPDRSRPAGGGAQLLEELRVQRRRLFWIQILKEDGGIGLRNVEEGSRRFGPHTYAKAGHSFKRGSRPLYWDSTTPCPVGRTTTPMS